MRLTLIVAYAAMMLPLWAQQDPVVKYSRSMGNGEFLLMAADADGDIVTVGRINSASFVPPAGAWQPRYAGGTCSGRPCYDAVVLKFRGSDGELLAGTFVGGTGEDLPTALAVDAQGNVYIAGSTTSRNFPRTEGSVGEAPTTSNSTGFVAKLNRSLSAAEFSTYLGGKTAATRIVAIAADRFGNAYLTGTTDAPDFPRTPGAYRMTGGPSTAFMTRISNGGRSYVASTFLGIGTPAAISADAEGNAVIAGTVSGDWPVSSDAPQPTRGGGADLFLTRVSGNGTGVLFSTFIGGSANDQATDLVLDAAGNAYIGGITYSPSFPGTRDVLGDAGTGFVLKFAGKSVAWTQAFRANGPTLVSAVQIDGEQNVIATGTTNSTHFPTTPKAYHRCVVPDAVVGNSRFLVRLIQDGGVRYSTLLHDVGAGERWAAPARGGDVFTLGRSSAPFGQPVNELSRLAFEATPAVRVDCAFNAASYRNVGVTPGMVVTIFGSGMGPAEGVQVGLVDGKLPTSVNGVRVLFNGLPAPLLYVREDQINAVVPFGAAGAASVQLRVEYGATATPPVSLSVKSAEPGIFRVGSSELGAILNEDQTLNTPSNPAARGSIVTFWGTGMGLYELPYEDGMIVGSNYSSQVQPMRVTVGGIGAQVLYAGAAPEIVAGVTQVNLRLAQNTRVSSRLPIAITVGDTTVSELAYVSVK